MATEYPSISINIWACLLLTKGAICYLFYVGQTGHVPVIYYGNLLISNVIVLCTMAAWIFIIPVKFNVKPEEYEAITVIRIIFWFAVVTGLCFRMCFAVERCFSVTFPHWKFIRKTKASVLLCVCVWLIPGVTVPHITFSELHLLPRIFSLLPLPVFIFCLAGTIKALPAAILMPAEEKRRTLAILVLLLLHYTLTILPLMIYDIHNIVHNIWPPSFFHLDIVWSLFRLGPLVDLILCLFLRSGPVDLLLASCCEMDNSVDEDVQNICVTPGSTDNNT